MINGMTASENNSRAGYLDRDTLSQTAGTLFMACLFAAKGLGSSDGEPVFKLFLVVSFLFWIAKLVLTRWEIKEAIISLVLVLFSAVSYRMSGEKGILICSMMFTGMKDMDLKKAFRVWTPVFGVSCVITVVLFFLGIAPDWTSPRYKFGMELTITNLGFPNHSVLSISYMVLVFMIIYTYGEKLKKWMYACMVLGCFAVFGITLSITGFAGTLLGLFLIAFRNRIPDAATAAAFPLCAALSILMPLLPPESAVFKAFDKLFNGRLFLSRAFLTSEFITPFGIRIYEDKIQMDDFYLDSSYVSALAFCGVVTALIFAVIYEVGILRMNADKDALVSAILITLLICGLSEPFLFNTSCKNLSLLFAGAAFYGKRPVPEDPDRIESEEEVFPEDTVGEAGASACSTPGRI